MVTSLSQSPFDRLETVAHSDPIHALEAVTWMRTWLDEREAEIVGAARSMGWGWPQIAEALGRTKQTVWERYRHIG